MFRNLAAGHFLLLLLAVTAQAADDKHSIRELTAQPAVDLDPAIAKLLSDRSVQLLDPKGNLLYQIWFRKEVPVKATPVQLKNGVTYQEIPETTLLGAIKIAQPTT